MVSHSLIVHHAHHKMGTLWMTDVLHDVAECIGVPFGQLHSRDTAFPVDPRGIFHVSHSHVMPHVPHVGSHMVRDLRDVIVSGYFYHLHTSEKWAHVKDAKLGGLSYQEYLNRLDKRAGLLAEIKRFSTTVNAHVLAKWDFSQPHIHELRYETLIADEVAGFIRLFDHYGIEGAQLAQSVEAALRHSITRKKKKEGSHVRSGRPGEWKEHFLPEHKRLFKKLLGPLLIRLKYALDDNW
jgi:hypothetical protein